MAEYAFLTTWLLDSPRQPVWEALHDQASWPQWWRGVEEAEELRRGEDGDIGSVARMVWKSLLPYRVEFEVTTTRVEHPYLLEGHAVGELEGIGRWRLYEHEGVTAVLVCDKGAKVDEASVLKALDGRLAKFKMPKRVFVVDELPRNAMGKVQKNILRDTYAKIYAK